ncbi:MAG: twin-arginine translocation signal domain-containing protein [Verrucomicrobiota bacterium]|nr:twin-arginine translocation signal domain-containing protein [Verrucomicrobiota bacterium]
MNRRGFLQRLTAGAATAATAPRLFAAGPPPKRVAAVVTLYTLNSHADVIVSRLLQTHTLDGQGPRANLQLVSLHVDQTPANDISRQLASDHGVALCDTIAEALLLGGKELAVDGVLLIAEHGEYGDSDTGQILYPRRRFFEETAAVFRRVGKSVPVFCDKHLAWNWEDAKWIYDTARELKAPLMAGSAVPVAWRHPVLEMTSGAPAREAVGLSFGPIEGYGFHGLEALQCLVERRRGGETGVSAVEILEGDAVWKACDAGRFNLRVFAAAANARQAKRRFRGEFRDAIKPAAFFIEYRDGFRAVVLHDKGSANSEWVVAWTEEGRDEHQATVFWTQEQRPLGHFAFLAQGIEKMFHTGVPTWPVERTLLTTGILAAIFQSRKAGARIETPHLRINYQPTFIWTEPPPPPPAHPRLRKQ